MQTAQTTDAHANLRALYRSLIDHEDRFHEFKQLLALYPTSANESGEESEAASVRERLNDRIRDWVGGPFEGLSAMQVLLWRSIVVEERFNIALSPWKEANAY
jgi:hypothetical protein